MDQNTQFMHAGSHGRPWALSAQVQRVGPWGVTAGQVPSPWPQAGDVVEVQRSGGQVLQAQVVSDQLLSDRECRQVGIPQLDVGPGFYAQVQIEGSAPDQRYALRVCTSDQQLLQNCRLFKRNPYQPGPAPLLPALATPAYLQQQSERPRTQEQNPVGQASAEPQFAPPALPDILDLDPASAEAFRTRLPEGCYLLRFTPANAQPNSYLWGTLRVHHQPSAVSASADLYLQRILPHDFDPTLRSVLSWPDPDPRSGIPHFPAVDYRYYMRLTAAYMHAQQAYLEFEPHLYDQHADRWIAQGKRICQLTAQADNGGPRQLQGDVRTADQMVRGHLHAIAVANHLRQATVDLYGQQQALQAEANLQRDLQQAGWNVQLRQGSAPRRVPQRQVWNRGEAHAALRDLYQSQDQSQQQPWNYTVLRVPQLDDPTCQGIAFAHTSPDGRPCSATVFGEGQVNRQGQDQSGNPHLTIAALGLNGPAGVLNDGPSSHAEHRLRHLPDIAARPDRRRSSHDARHSTDMVRLDVQQQQRTGLSLQVLPLAPAVPLGAPVRLTLRIHNRGAQALPLPQRIALESGTLSGQVRSHGGQVRRIGTEAQRIAHNPLQPLAPNAHIEVDVLLLSGPDGALFASPGLHEVTVHLHYLVAGVPLCLTGNGSIMVGSALDGAHSLAAHQVLSSRELPILCDVLGDHLSEGRSALQAALAQPVLRPHFLAIEAARLATPFFERQADHSVAHQCLQGNCVLSQSERQRLQRLVQQGQQASQEHFQAVAPLQRVQPSGSLTAGHTRQNHPQAPDEAHTVERTLGAVAAL